LISNRQSQHGSYHQVVTQTGETAHGGKMEACISIRILVQYVGSSAKQYMNSHAPVLRAS